MTNSFVTPARKGDEPICNNDLDVWPLSSLAPKQIIAEHFDAVPFEGDWIPRYNIAPTQPVPVTCQNPEEPRRVLSLMPWGLIPSWVKDISGSASLINARSQTAPTKPAFREPMKFRRCLV